MPNSLNVLFKYIDEEEEKEEEEEEEEEGEELEHKEENEEERSLIISEYCQHRYFDHQNLT